MDRNIEIRTNEVRISINNDPNRIIVFDPTAIIFADKFYSLMNDVDDKIREFEKQIRTLDKDQAIDENGIFENMAERLKLIKETGLYFRDKIDQLFGAGTSQTAFGDSINLDIFPQFFDGIAPIIQEAREKKTEKYLTVSDKKKSHNHSGKK